MSISIIPKFSNIFPEVPIPELENLLSDVPSKIMIKVLSFINGKLYINESIEEQEHLFMLMIERLPENEITSIKANYLEFIKNYSRKDLYIFPLYVILQLIEWEVSNYRNIDTEDFTPEQELKILQAILIFNEKLDNSHKSRGEALDKSESLIKLIWENALPQLEFTGRRLYFNQFLLGFEFIDYLEKTYPKHFKSYLKYLNISSKEEIFKGIFEFMINGYNKEGNNYRNNFSIEFIQKNRLLEPLILDIKALNNEEYTLLGYNKYFKGLRKYPLIKHDDQTFDVINWNFVSDRMTANALIFDFYYNSSIKSDNQFHDFKSDVGIKFSEKSFFISFMKRTFNSDNYTHLTGETNNKITSDYYLRLDNKIILIEYKDYTVADAIKNGNFENIKDYIISNFFKSKSGKAKGVLQLINQLDTLNSETNLIENFEEHGIDKSRIIIFPIIITKDFSFNINGFNYYLNKKFKAEIKQKKYPFFLITDLIVVDLKRLMDWSDELEENRITLPSLLYNYLLKISYYKEAAKRQFKTEITLDSIASFYHSMIPKETKLITETKEFIQILDRLKISK